MRMSASDRRKLHHSHLMPYLYDIQKERNTIVYYHDQFIMEKVIAVSAVSHRGCFVMLKA